MPQTLLDRFPETQRFNERLVWSNLDAVLAAAIKASAKHKGFIDPSPDLSLLQQYRICCSNQSAEIRAAVLTDSVRESPSFKIKSKLGFNRIEKVNFVWSKTGSYIEFDQSR